MRGFNSNAIHAPRRDFATLADGIEQQLSNAKVGSQFHVKHVFCPDSEYDMAVVVKPDDFEPGTFDSWVTQQLAARNGNCDNGAS